MKYITYDATNKIRILRKTKHMIFKAGDTVYHWEEGSGRVLETLQGSVRVIWGHNLSHEWINSPETRYLSFTPYNLVDGGFSQYRPRPDIKPGQLIYVRDEEDEEWYMRYFSHWSDKHKLPCCYVNQKRNIPNTQPWAEYSITNPLEE